MGQEHETDNDKCWCGPDLYQVCPEWSGVPGDVCEAGCWACKGSGLVAPYDDTLDTIIVHQQVKEKEEQVAYPIEFCCKMREKYMVSIVAENAAVKEPAEVLDFMDFDVKTDDGRPIIRIKFCPFCGRPVAGPLRVM